MPLLFGIGCAVSLWFAAQSRDPDAGMLARALVVMWALMNVAWLLDAMWVFPLVDLGAGLIALRMLVRRDADWIYAFVCASFVRLELHACDFLTGHAFIVPYLHALNATFVWMLVAVAFTGGGHAIDRLRGGVRHYLRALRPASASATAP